MFILETPGVTPPLPPEPARSINFSNSSNDSRVDTSILNSLQNEHDSVGRELNMNNSLLNILDERSTVRQNQGNENEGNTTNETLKNNERASIQVRIDALTSQLNELGNQITTEEDRVKTQEQGLRAQDATRREAAAAEAARRQQAEQARAQQEGQARLAQQGQTQQTQTTQNQNDQTARERDLAQMQVLAQQNKAVQEAQARQSTQNQPTEEQGTTSVNGNGTDPQPNRQQIAATQEQDAANARRMNSGDTTST